MREDRYHWLCPTCGRRGAVVQHAPVCERICSKGHRWQDGRVKKVSGYLPLGVRLEEATMALEAALEAMTRAEVALKDCLSVMPPEQWKKLSIHTEVHQVAEAKKRLAKAIKASLDNLPGR
jgi:hypothetical protein